MRPRARLPLLQRRRRRSECLHEGVEVICSREVSVLGCGEEKLEVSESRRLAADFDVLNSELRTEREESTAPNVSVFEETILSLKTQVLEREREQEPL